MTHPKNATPQIVGGLDASGNRQTLKVTDGELLIGGTVDYVVDKANASVRFFPARLTWANGTDRAITATASQILAANANRDAVFIVHRSGTADVLVGSTGLTSTSYIWRLQPGEMLYWVDGVSTAAVFGITASGTANLTASEGTS